MWFDSPDDVELKNMSNSRISILSSSSSTSPTYEKRGQTGCIFCVCIPIYSLSHSEHEKHSWIGLVFLCLAIAFPLPSSSPHPSMRTGAKLATFLVFVFLFFPSHPEHKLYSQNGPSSLPHLSPPSHSKYEQRGWNGPTSHAWLLPHPHPHSTMKMQLKWPHFSCLTSTSLLQLPSHPMWPYWPLFVFVFPISRILFLYIFFSSSNEIYLLLPKIVQLSVEMTIHFLVRVGHGWSFPFVPITLDNTDYSNQCWSTWSGQIVQ